MTKLTASILILFSVIVPAGMVSISLGSQTDLTIYQIELLQTSSQICYGGSAALFALLTAKTATQLPSDQHDPKDD